VFLRNSKLKRRPLAGARVKHRGRAAACLLRTVLCTAEGRLHNSIGGERIRIRTPVQRPTTSPTSSALARQPWSRSLAPRSPRPRRGRAPARPRGRSAARGTPCALSAPRYCSRTPPRGPRPRATSIPLRSRAPTRITGHGWSARAQALLPSLPPPCRCPRLLSSPALAPPSPPLPS
jgi:hypothetical protein